MSCLSKHWGYVLDMALQMSPSHLSLKASSFWRKIQTMWRVRTNVIHNDITCTQLWLCSYYGLLLLCCTPVRNMQCMFGLERCTLARVPSYMLFHLTPTSPQKHTSTHTSTHKHTPPHISTLPYISTHTSIHKHTHLHT